MFDSELNHMLLVQKMQQKLAYSSSENYDEWHKKIKDKFIELNGLDEIAKNACQLNVQIEWEKEKENCKIIRFTFESEVGETVPCYLCVPKTGKKKYPVAIVLQGHATGFHLSIGEKKFPEDATYQEKGHGSFALQAVENGYIGLAIEQRGMGERKPHSGKRLPMEMCRYASQVAIQLGRTILGERMWDVARAIDALATFPECDLDKILITGNSGGGTMSFYAACYDERIKLSVPSCAFCPYKDSILNMYHCPCNYIPSAFKWFEMQDLSCLIAPRNLIVIAGKEDGIFPIDGVRRGFETVKKIYAQNGVEDNCKLIETPKGHWWCEDLVWQTINEETSKLGW